VLPSGGTWTNVQSYASAGTFSWTAPSPNTYSVVIWARQSGAPAGNTYETFGDMSVSTS
jgi:hypothetical protein